MVRLTKPELESFIDAQVKAGRFLPGRGHRSGGRANDARRWGLDEATLAVIDASEDQIEQGRVRDCAVSRTLLAKYLGK